MLGLRTSVWQGLGLSRFSASPLQCSVLCVFAGSLRISTLNRPPCPCGRDRYPQTHTVAAAAAPSHACWMNSRPRSIAASLVDVRQCGVGFLGLLAVSSSFLFVVKVSGVGAWGFWGELGPVPFPCSRASLFSKHPLEFSFGGCCSQGCHGYPSRVLAAPPQTLQAPSPHSSNGNEFKWG